jgi:PhzF family phenazine biosynthesis protein
VTRQFRQVDVFTDTAYLGNPLAVVLGADGLTDEQMRLFARWTNLSETTFVLAPRASEADYRVRIFTPAGELPFAGHPTLGTCHAWLEAGGRPAAGGTTVQECDAGLIPLRQTATGLAFAAPPLLRGGPVDEPVAEHVAAVLNIKRDDIVDIQWADNGPGWVAVLLASAEAVLAVRPGPVDMDIGVAGLYPEGSPAALEVRAFSPQISSSEDPVTGSLNASLGQWLFASGRIATPYVASQGTALGRRGRVHVSRDDDGQVWVGGATVTCVSGTVELLGAGLGQAPGTVRQK